MTIGYDKCLVKYGKGIKFVQGDIFRVRDIHILLLHYIAIIVLFNF